MNTVVRKINNINTSELIDEGIILWFPGPESYTGEDMAEIHVHGGKAGILAVQKEIAKKVLEKVNQNLSGKAVTNISLVKNYCPAEEYHQRYLEKK